MDKIKKLQKKAKTKKKIVVRRMVLNEKFEMEFEEIKVEQKKKLRKAPL